MSIFRVLRSHREPFWRENKPKVFIFWFVALLAVSHLLGELWVFEYPGLRATEILQRASPVVANFSRVVKVDDEDYRSWFQECLTPDALGPAIERILEYDPAVVVIDFDTSAKRFADSTALQKLRLSPKVVWARLADEQDSDGEVRFDLAPVLGGLDNPPSHWGLALFPRDRDWTVREYQRSFTVGSRQKPALFWEAVTTFCSQQDPRSEKCRNVLDISANLESGRSTELEVPVRHAPYNFRRFLLREIMPLASNPSMPASKHSELSGKIVIFGGSYSRADKHVTALGVQDGVDLVASAVESQLNPRESRELDRISEVSIDALLYFAVSLMYYYWRPKWAVLGSLSIVGLLFVFGPVVALVAGYRTSAIPFVLGILIEQMTRGVEAREELHEALEELKQLKASTPH